MDCLIPGANIRVVNRSIQALSKISDELYIEAEADRLSFLAINMNKTAYAKFTFHSIFFINYKLEVVADMRTTCKIHMKSLLYIFKHKLEKKAEVCQITFRNDATQLLVKIKYKQDSTMVHNLKLIDFDYLVIDYNADEAKNKITATGQVFNQILSNFQAADSNLTLEMNANKIALRNYDVGVATTYKGMRSQIVLSGSEFHSYSIAEEGSIVLSLKPFRSAISFAEVFNIPVTLNFRNGGWPIIVSMKDTAFEVDYILATISPVDVDVQSTSTVDAADPVLRCLENKSFRGSVNASMEVAASEKTLTVGDKDLMESVNWDEDFGDEVPLSPPIASENYSREDKRAKIFGRCFDPTFHTSMLDFGDDLAANSDSD